MTKQEEHPVLLDFPEAGVARLRLNRPKLNNALNLELQSQLSNHFAELGHNPDVRCILLTGYGFFGRGRHLLHGGYGYLPRESGLPFSIAPNP